MYKGKREMDPRDLTAPQLIELCMAEESGFMRWQARGHEHQGSGTLVSSLLVWS